MKENYAHATGMTKTEIKYITEVIGRQHDTTWSQNPMKTEIPQQALMTESTTEHHIPDAGHSELNDDFAILTVLHAQLQPLHP